VSALGVNTEAINLARHEGPCLISAFEAMLKGALEADVTVHQIAGPRRGPFAGEPTGIGEKGTGQTQKSTERQQSPNAPDLSQVPRELSEGQSAQAAQELNRESQANKQLSQEEPAGIGEKGTGQTKQSTERQ